jgi:hypothetical protein
MRKSCENCDSSIATPCAHCYPDRNFRWAALKTFNTGSVPSRFNRYEFCETCMSFLCDCGVSDYEEAIFKYLEQVAPGWVRPTRIATEEDKSEGEGEGEDSPIDLKAWTLSQIAEAEWSHPLTELPHQTVIKGVSFCNSCWRTLASTASGCYCFGAADCSCDPDAGTTDPCPACCHDRDLRKEAAMEFLVAP